jgi:maleamate amidohydrolase
VDHSIWEPFLTERDRAHADVWGKTELFGFGARPVLIVVDDYYSVLGFEREEILESIKSWPNSCGLEGWEAIDRTVTLIDGARANDVPIIYLHGYGGFPNKPLGHWGQRIGGPRHDAPHTLDHIPAELRAMANVIVEEIAPRPSDLVIEKAAPSGFNGTPLLAQLNYLDADTIIVCGETTSGCVRATVTDGASYRYNVGVVADCCFDRTEASHYINLFDMHQKYADVVDLNDAVEYFESNERMGAQREGSLGAAEATSS